MCSGTFVEEGKLLKKSTVDGLRDAGVVTSLIGAHVVEMAGAAAKAVGCPVGPAVERAGRAIADKAVAVATRDHARLTRGSKGA